MNKWQKIYCDLYYDGKLPRSKAGKNEFALLGQCKNKIIVHFPEFTGANGTVPAHVETYEIVEQESDCDMPNGRISVGVLAGNLALWTHRGYKIKTL